MRFTITSAAAVLLLASLTPAVAQAPAPEPVAPMETGINWTGCYLGPTVGTVFGNTHVSGVPNGAFPTGEPTIVPNLTAISSGNFSPRGAIGGGEVGCNYQWNHLVFGLEADGSGMGFSGGSSAVGPGDPLTPGSTLTSQQSSRSGWLATFRPRFGYAFDNNLLAYVTGGLDVAGAKAAQVVAFSATSSTQTGAASKTGVSWVAGGGLEYALSPQWSLKGEYLYANLPSVTVNEFNPGFPTFTETTKFTSHASILRVALNYRFWQPTPPPPAPAAMPAPPPAAARVFIVFFDWDKDVVTPEGQAIIRQAADAYRSGARVQLQVTGYTDRSGSPGYNQRLSERRANNVARALAALGVPKNQMVVTGRGENDNRVPTAPGVREPQNRRVEIVAP